jgi:hypothetical protein
MIFFRSAAIVISLATYPILVGAQTTQSVQPVIRVEFNDAALIPSHWTLELHTDSTAHFHSDRAVPDPQTADPTAPSIPLIDRDLKLSPAFTERFFSTARERNLFNFKCESRNKVAYQGTKTLTYTGPDGHGSCQFNYSSDSKIQELSESVTALVASIVEGFKLASLQTHDRLGLDREMEFVSEAVKDGRLQQIGVIREQLEHLAADDALLDRVRHRAMKLLAQINQQDTPH